MKKNLLKVAALFAVSLVSLAASAIDKVEKVTVYEELQSLEEIANAEYFYLQNSEGQVLCIPENWDMKVQSLETSQSNNDAGGYYRLQNTAEHYALAIYNWNKSRRNFWAGESYVNAQLAGGDVIFGLAGSAPQYGQDGQDLALWDVTFDAENGFAFQCVGNPIYLGFDSEAARPSNEPVYWTAYKASMSYNEADVVAKANEVMAANRLRNNTRRLKFFAAVYAEDKDLDQYAEAVNQIVDDINTAEAYFVTFAAFNAEATASVKEAYEAGKFENAAEVGAALTNAVKIEANTDMTSFIVNPNIDGADGWTIDRPVGGNGPLLNGNSFEYWAGNASDRANASFDYYQVVRGIPNGVYTVSADMHNSLNNEEGSQWKATCAVYGNDQYQLCDVEGDQLNTYTTPAITVTDGTLTLGVRSIEPLAARWFVADNFKLTLVEQAEEAAPEYAEWYTDSKYTLVGHDFIGDKKLEYSPVRYISFAGIEGKDDYAEVTTNDNPVNLWDSQLFITVDEPLKSGMTLTLTMKVASNVAGAKFDAQLHKAAGEYAAICNNSALTFAEADAWYDYSLTYVVDNPEIRTFAFNLAQNTASYNFMFKDVNLDIQAVPEYVWTENVLNANSFFVSEQAVPGGPFSAAEAEVYNVQSSDSPANGWDTQFFIRSPYVIPAGTRIRLEFDYMASQATKPISTQAHHNPSEYNHWDILGKVTFTPEWNTFSKEILISSDHAGANGFCTVAFNLAEEETATLYSFKNIALYIGLAAGQDLVPAGDFERPTYPQAEPEPVIAFADWYTTEAFSFVAHDYIDGEKQEYAQTRYMDTDIETDDVEEDYIEVTTNENPAEIWDSQLFVTINEPLEVGQTITFSMNVSSDLAGAKFDGQLHGKPGEYIGGLNNSAYTIEEADEWYVFSTTFTVGDVKAKTLAFNLAQKESGAACNFYFQDFAIDIKPAPKYANLIVNSEMEEEDNSCFFETVQGAGGPYKAVFTEGAGVDGSRGIEITSGTNPSQAWDTQFFIRLPYYLPAGTYALVEFDYKASENAKSITQSHGEPGTYQHWAAIDDVNFTTEWQSFSKGITIDESMAGSNGFLSIAFNLAEVKTPVTYQIDNVRIWVDDEVVGSLVAAPENNAEDFPVDIPGVTAGQNGTKNGKLFKNRQIVIISDNVEYNAAGAPSLPIK